MAKRKIQKAAPKHARQTIQIFGVVLLILGLLLLVSLLTYDRLEGDQAVGWFGGWLAWLLSSIMGYGAYVLTACVFLLGWNRFRLKLLEEALSLIGRSLILTGICCVAIAVPSGGETDSRTILDANGADQLLGKGDMLYLAPGRDPVRIHGAFISSQEINHMVKTITAQNIPPQYVTLEQ